MGMPIHMHAATVTVYWEIFGIKIITRAWCSATPSVVNPKYIQLFGNKNIAHRECAWLSLVREGCVHTSAASDNKCVASI